MRARLLAFLLVGAITGCSSESTRRVTLASPDRAMDEALSSARQSALEGDLEHAEAALRALVEHHATDPLAPAAQLLLARVVLARGDLHGAERIARATDVTRDPSLTHTQKLVLGVAAARARASGDALTLLRPLEGRLPDRAETAELSCALAESELRAGDPGRALRAVALVDSLAKDGTAWLPTGLMCEQPETRLALIEQAAARVRDPASLTAALDALPADSPLAPPLAVRLRALADQTHETARYLSYMRLLPAEDSTRAPIVPSTRAERIVIGVLAPESGPRSVVGVAMLRGAEFGVEGVDNAFVIPEDEGDSPATAVAAFDRLVAHGALAVVGVSREDFSAAVAIRAQSAGIELWLVAPAQGVDATGAHVHLAGPSADARTEALVHAVRNRGPRATMVVPASGGEMFDRLERRLSAAGIATTRSRLDEIAPRLPDANGAVVLAADPLGRETRTAMARAAARAPSRWVFEARAALPGGSGTWVGVLPGAGFAALLPAYCTRVGEPPDEVALLAYDAARAAVAFARSQPMPAPALAVGFGLTTATIAPNAPRANDWPAAAARCE